MTEQNTKMTDNMRASMYSTILVQTLEMDKVFLANPELRPYFYEGQNVSDVKKDTKAYQKIMTIAEYQLDYFELVGAQLDYIPEDKDTKEEQEVWGQYFADSFAKSPVLCKRLKADPGWYMDRLVKIAEDNCK